MSVYTKLAQLHNAAAFGPWLLQIVRRRALQVRQAPRHEPINGDTPVPSTGSPDWIKPFEEAVQQLRRLPEHDRVIVVMRYWTVDR